MRIDKSDLVFGLQIAAITIVLLAAIIFFKLN